MCAGGVVIRKNLIRGILVMSILAILPRTWAADSCEVFREKYEKLQVGDPAQQRLAEIFATPARAEHSGDNTVLIFEFFGCTLIFSEGPDGRLASKEARPPLNTLGRPPARIGESGPSRVPEKNQNAQKVTVHTWSHRVFEHDYAVTTPLQTKTECQVLPDPPGIPTYTAPRVTCNSTTYGGGSQTKAIFDFIEIVTAKDESGEVMQYTLARTARWMWSSDGMARRWSRLPSADQGDSHVHQRSLSRRQTWQGLQDQVRHH